MSEAVRKLVCGDTPDAPGRYRSIALVAETAADAQKVLVGGPSGILACHPPNFRPRYIPSRRHLQWPNGAVATTYNGTEPDQLRGPQHDLVVFDELAKYAKAQETWDQAQFGLRLGPRPLCIIATTPRPIQVIRDIMADPATFVTRGRTTDNAENLSANFIANIVKRYSGTRLGRQELDAEILEDVPGGLWTGAMIEACHWRGGSLPDFARVVVAIDPSGSGGDNADEVGISVCAKGVDGDYYVLADRSARLGPSAWAVRAVDAFREFSADRIVAETNYGGAMVEAIIRTIDRNIPYEAVVASRGKVVRAEPVAALYEQGRVWHIGDMPALEDQLLLMTGNGYAGGSSPDKVDALVWGITSLMADDGFNTADWIKAYGT